MIHPFSKFRFEFDCEFINCWSKYFFEFYQTRNKTIHEISALKLSAEISRSCLVSSFNNIFVNRWARVLGQGGVDTGGCPQNIFRPPSAAGKFFCRRRHRGVKNFFRWGVYLVDRGVILPKNPKNGLTGGSKFFFSGVLRTPGCTPPLFFSRRVSGKFSA